MSARVMWSKKSKARSPFGRRSTPMSHRFTAVSTFWGSVSARNRNIVHHTNEV
jgi:hypothetical protein